MGGQVQPGQVVLSAAPLTGLRRPFARGALKLGTIFPSLPLEQLYMIHGAEWATITLPVRNHQPSRVPVLSFMVHFNGDADDYIASVGLIVRRRTDVAFGRAVDWPRWRWSIRELIRYVHDHQIRPLYHYSAYLDATVTDVVASLPVLEEVRNLLPAAQHRAASSASQFRADFHRALTRVARPPSRSSTFLDQVRHFFAAHREPATNHCSTYWLPVREGQADQVLAAVHELPRDLFDRARGTHFAALGLFTHIVNGGTRLELTTPHLVVTMHHDGAPEEHLVRVADGIGADLAPVLAHCELDASRVAAWEPHRADTALLVQGYDRAPLDTVTEALADRATFLELGRDAPGLTDDELRDEFARRFGQPAGVAAAPRNAIRPATLSRRALARVPAALRLAPTRLGGMPWPALRHVARDEALSRDVQGNVLEAYGRNHLRAALGFFAIEDPAAARSWVGAMCHEITTALYGSPDVRTPALTCNLSFTIDGLRKLGIGDRHLRAFSEEFREGMGARAAAHLGDQGASAARCWQETLVHGVDGIIDVRGPSLADGNHGDDGDGDDDGGDDKVRARLLAILDAGQATGAISVRDIQVGEAETSAEKPHWALEPFGYADGISQPFVEESYRLLRRGRLEEPLRLGEFVLGHPDEDGEPERSQSPDLVRNGSYLVYRKLEQDVAGFDALVRSDRDDLAAKLMGRGFDGRPLAFRGWLERSLYHRTTGVPGTDVTYRGDEQGFACPLGAHIRRANPRDSLDRKGQRARRHRLIRRGVPYVETVDGDERRGLHFMAYCAHIDRQYEFVQQWLIGGNFLGLGNESDPIAGAPGTYTIQGDPPQFLTIDHPLVTTRAGGYFFQPGMEALGLLAAGEFAT